jgi:sec-independent protein translocase protein TatA
MNTVLFAWVPGIPELLICLVIMLILFGNRLPSVMRSLGSSAREFKKGAEGIGEDIEEAGKASPKEPSAKSLDE